MGFFGDMRSINKIYGLLNEIEPLMLLIGEMAHSNSSDRQLLIETANKIRIYLNELIRVNQNAGNTVQCADFQFMGGKYRIGYIITAISEVVKVIK